MGRRVVAPLGADRDGVRCDSWLGPGARTGCRQPPDAVNVHVEFHPLAVDEIASTVDWYERQRSGLGMRFLDVVETTVNRASGSPRIGTPVVADQGARRCERCPWADSRGRWRTRSSASRSSFLRCFTNGDFPTTGWNVPSSGVARGPNPSKISSKKRSGTSWISAGTRRTRKPRKTCSAASSGTRRTPERLLMIRRSWVRAPPAPPPTRR